MISHARPIPRILLVECTVRQAGSEFHSVADTAPTSGRVAIDRTQVGENVQDLLLGFAESEHQATFGFDFRVPILNSLKHFQRPFVNRLGSTDATIKSWYRFGVVIENIRSGIDHLIECLFVANKVGASKPRSSHRCVLGLFSMHWT